MIAPTAETLHGWFDRDLPPVVTVEPGSTVTVGCLDSGWSTGPFDGGDLAARPRHPAWEPGTGHALTGPIAVRGAQPGQVLAIGVGALAGLWLCRAGSEPGAGMLRFPVSRTVGWVCLAALVALLIGSPIVAALTGSGAVSLFDAFFRAGALVFGGGHVVLPLLEAEIVQTGWLSADAFLAGYGAAQALPGPLFSVAAYLGAVLEPAPNGLAGAAIALSAIFLPGFMLLLGVLPFWDALRAKAGMQALMQGANAAVVGVLGAALYDPVFTSAVVDPKSFALALTCFVLLTVWKTPPWLVVIVGALGGILIKA